MSERATKALGGQDRCEHQRLAAEVDPQNPALDDQRLLRQDWRPGRRRRHKNDEEQAKGRDVPHDLDPHGCPTQAASPFRM